MEKCQSTDADRDFGALQLVVVKAYPDREFSSQLLACALPAGDSATCKAAMELFLTQTPWSLTLRP